jgi:hypothetical protein
MKRVLTILLLAACVHTCHAGDGFKPLFNGKDLKGWKTVNCAPSTFTVRNGMIFCTGKPTGVMRTEKMYENFVLQADWRHLDKEGNSGIFIWSDATTAKGQPFTRAIEVQVMVGSEADWYTSDGDVFPIHGAVMKPENPRPKGGDRAYPTEKRMRPGGEWNHYEITCKDGSISLAVNGKMVTRGHDVNPRRGYICLESEGSPIEFKNIRIKEMPPAKPPLTIVQIARKDDGFLPMYTGVDFSGWRFEKVHEGHFKADDWMITFDGGGDDLWTQKSYKDFVMVCDWRWTAKPETHELPVLLPNGDYRLTNDGTQMSVPMEDAGDSGIYLRGNSKSQVNIWCWSCGSSEVHGYVTDEKLPREVRAGGVPKERADAAIGQWNRFVITMKGDRLTVVLNNKTVIDNAQLLGVPSEGPIALQHHGGAIQFANLFIKEMK